MVGALCHVMVTGLLLIERAIVLQWALLGRKRTPSCWLAFGGARKGDK